MRRADATLLIVVAAVLAGCAGQDSATNTSASNVEIIPYRMTVEWEGREGPLRGVLLVPKSGLSGPLTVDLGGSVGLCDGTFNYTKEPQGVWSIDCGSGVSASGTFVHYGGPFVVTGYGEDSEGNAIDFDALPPASRSSSWPIC